MSARTRAPGGVGGLETTDLGIAALIAVAGLGGVCWLAAVIAGVVTGRGVPAGTPMNALTAVTNVGDPASGWPTPAQIAPPAAYWTSTLVLLGLTLALSVLGWRYASGTGPDRSTTAASRLRHLPGMATRAELTASAGSRSVLGRAAQARPSRATTRNPAEVGYRLGHGRGRELWCSVEDSALLIGPPRMGKGLHVVIPWILDAPGPVVTTSTRPDTLAATARHRARSGPVAVFDPQRLTGFTGGLRWSPVRGCESPRTAIVRARGLVAGAGLNTPGSDLAFWAGQTETALRCLLHAAALKGAGPLELYQWALNPSATGDALDALGGLHAAPGWNEALAAVVHADPRTRDSVWLGVRQSFAALSDPDVLAAVDPGPGEQFDPVTFLRDCGTLYLLASATTSGSCAPLVSALVEDVTETARLLAARAPAARLDPPLLLALDEIANLTPLPSLPSLMAEGGGSGITTLAVFQSLAQARHRWGEHAADAIWDAATVKIVLGGLAKMRDLDDVSRLLGEVDEPTRSDSRGRSGERSTTVSMRQVPIMPPALLRTLPFGSGVLLLRHTRPAVIDLGAWTSRSDADQLSRDREAVETAARTGTRLLPVAPAREDLP